MPDSTRQLPAFRNGPAAALLAVCTALALIASTATLIDDHWLFAATGMWALTIVMLPVAMSRHYDPFSIWSFVILTVVVGVTLRGVCMSFGFPDAARLDHLFFRGESPAYFYPAAGCLLLGILMLCIGYLSFPFRPHRFSLPAHHCGRVALIGGAVLVTSSLATYWFIQKTGGFDSGLWSAKRTVIPDIELAGSGYQSFGGLRFIAGLAIFGHLLVLAETLSAKRQRRKILLGMLALALLIVACIVPFYASLRTTVALNLCMSAAMLWYAGRRFTNVTLVAIGGVLLITVYAMNVLRPGAADSEDGLASPTVARVFKAAVINRNQIELAKTAHIMHALGDELSLQYGQTIARWALAPIPRSLWRDKPVIPPGPEIGHEVYGQPVAGVPPSLVGELYWNFHLPGVIVGAFAFGMLLRFLQAQFSPVGNNLLTTSLYVAGPMTLGFEAVGSSIGSGLFRAALQTAAMLLLVLMVIKRQRPSH